MSEGIGRPTAMSIALPGLSAVVAWAGKALEEPAKGPAATTSASLLERETLTGSGGDDAVLGTHVQIAF